MNYLGQVASDNAMRNVKFLIILPIITYIVSYFYLAFYHGKIFIFSTIVHEGGTHTLLQSMFYASHFLGHIPVHTLLAFLFTGTYLCLTGNGVITYSKKKELTLLISLILFLVSSFILSLCVFGFEDTFAFMAQGKQSDRVYAEGGSWNLHLPSTMLLFFMMPAYLYSIIILSGRCIRPNAGGLSYISFAFLLLFLFTFFFNRNSIDAFVLTWRDPRYLAHSVRELLTFPVAYFPVPLYFMLKGEKNREASEKNKVHGTFFYFIVFLATTFLLGVIYQSYIPITKGIGSLAQKPAFARGGNLGIPYLLASHYFEHFLDTIYFTLLCLLLHGRIKFQGSNG